ncbi:hypothetical protein GCM10010992_25640 [Cloacibacterium rupense]|uniref:DUF3575 domain-containing protein n=1 Tax=Cloacibacterium rupense TaxID=517423 RepID=A0ABQ2NLA3_9FLAO|nr:DUF3575 domain-containing protein [Cloacibacterium rupense]GGP06236.1 hypothetical protein GCM10010992_25640 [Cloacibacterium rupense]
MNKLKTFFLITFFLFFGDKINAQTYAKVNMLGLPLGMLNAGVEAKVSDNITLQPEFFISPWRSFLGNRLQIYNFNLEGRYYFKESFNHFYIGGNAGIAIFDIQKWNYLNSNQYQRGYSLLFGVTVGYQYPISEKLNIDMYLGGATSQGFYHGYDIVNGQRYEPKNPWNRSGELIPYKVGVALSYKIN